MFEIDIFTRLGCRNPNDESRIPNPECLAVANVPYLFCEIRFLYNLSGFLEIGYVIKLLYLNHLILTKREKFLNVTFKGKKYFVKAFAKNQLINRAES